ncbi:Solute carrier organic anion transporter family member 1C1-like protein [Dinothrombium tinctorium]|uniref:Solute carrier organic anion transporter family member n=1 Tax=Dinothrombium tinctorium TaxID=1965070 RepID=A0A3S3PEF1_9ACAR|nr:Solute carrier organic anion transporter family member 1C1-like protein [Dinothrombium tinctorium]
MAKVDESDREHDGSRDRGTNRNGECKSVLPETDLDTEQRSNGKCGYNETNMMLQHCSPSEQDAAREMDAPAVCQQQLLQHQSQNFAYNDEETCGLCSLRPKWLQIFASKQAFLVTFCLTSVLQGMYHTYFVSVLTTIEKLYQIQSKTTGIIMSATEIGQIGGALVLTYYGGRGHRPKWIAYSILLFAVASILSSSPHLLYGSEHHFNHRVSLSDKEDDKLSISFKHLRNKLCFKPNNTIVDFLHLVTSNYSISEHINSNTSANENLSSFTQEISSKNNDCDNSDGLVTQTKVTYTALPIFFISRLLIGLGATAVNTLGIPYIDDNVAPKESPLYFGIMIGVRILGPVFGFLLGAVCTNIYVNFPFEQPINVKPSDPQWVGCWWLGLDIVGLSLLLTSIIMVAFPRKLPKPDPSSYCHKQQQNYKQPLINGLFSNKKSKAAKIVNQSVKDGKPNLKDFPATVKRLLKNKVLLLRTASSVLHILPVAGVYTFLPKFLESQFQLTASETSAICAIFGILVMGVGIFASGIFMRKYNPSPRFVAQWIAISALLYSLGMVILMFLGCPLNNIVGLNASNNENIHCDKSCSCSKGDYSPICVNENVTYISPCLAGCSGLASINETFLFSNCKCLAENAIARNGPCSLNCGNLVWYILIFSIFVLVHSTSEVGSMLLTLRCVEPQDKAMALGLISFAIGLFGNVPCPIIYGAFVDSACLFWEHSCGKAGACRVYDPSKFRLVFHGLTAFLMFIAFIVDSLVWYKASDISFHDEDEQQRNNATETDTALQTMQTESCV